MSLSRFQYSTVSPYYTSTTRTAGGDGPPGIVIDNFPGLRNGLANGNASILARMDLADGSNLGATWHLLLASLGCISCQTVNRTSSAPVLSIISHVQVHNLVVITMIPPLSHLEQYGKAFHGKRFQRIVPLQPFLSDAKDSVNERNMAHQSSRWPSYGIRIL